MKINTQTAELSLRTLNKVVGLVGCLIGESTSEALDISRNFPGLRDFIFHVPPTNEEVKNYAIAIFDYGSKLLKENL